MMRRAVELAGHVLFVLPMQSYAADRTVFSGDSWRVTSIPAWRNADWVAWICDWSAGKPFENISGMLRLAPDAIPGPHSPAPVPGFVHFAAPEDGIVQPCEVSSCLAAVTLYGNGLVVAAGF